MVVLASGGKNGNKTLEEFAVEGRTKQADHAGSQQSITEGRQEVTEAQRMDICFGPWWSGHTFAPEQTKEKLNLILLFLLQDWNYRPYLGTGLAPPTVTMRGSRPPGAPNPQMRGRGLLLIGTWVLGPGPAQRYSQWKEGALAGRSDLGGALNQPQFISPQSRTGPQDCPWLLRVEEGQPRPGPRLPDYAPLRLDAHDGGVLHVLEEQVLVDPGLVHLHHHLHFQHLV